MQRFRGSGAAAFWLLVLILVARRQHLKQQRRQLEPPPNLLLFSVDDNVDMETWDLAYMQTLVAANARNPNRCRAPITWFSSWRAFNRTTATSDCDTVRRAYKRGHELATHTVLHRHGADNFTYADWAAEIGGQRQWLASCGIPPEEVVGFRAPYFKFNALLGFVLQDLGFLYDSSLYMKEHAQPAHIMSAVSPWPYKYCAESFCSNWSSLSIWEVPGFVLPGRGVGAGKRVDPLPVSNLTVLQRLQADFERKRGSGVPIPVFVHSKYLNASDSHQEVLSFFQWAYTQPNTWALTFRQYIDWLQAPPNTSLAKLLSKYTCDAS